MKIIHHVYFEGESTEKKDRDFWLKIWRIHKFIRSTGAINTGKKKILLVEETE